MKILWFLDKEFDVAFNVSARLATLKHLEKNNDVHVVTTYRHTKKKFDNIRSRVTYLDRVNLPFVKTLFLFRQHLRFLGSFESLGDYDVVFLNSSNMFLLKRLASLRAQHGFKLELDVRTLPVDHNFFKRQLHYFFFRRSVKIAARLFDGISYITEEMRDYCIRKFHLPDHPSSVWSSGVDFEHFKPLPQPETKTETHPGENPQFRLMYHGKVDVHRGIHHIVRAMALLNRPPDIELYLLGAQEEMADLKKLAERLNLTGRVFFHPTVPYQEVPAWINRIDAGVLPFPQWPPWNTCSPIKLFEYLACGKPVVATSIPAHKSVLGGKSFAFLADAPGPRGLANAIEKAASPKNNFKKIAEDARNFVKMNFGWDTQLAEFERFLRSLR
jgi:glycosyltransferase involved in cell wall biosynthesis